MLTRLLERILAPIIDRRIAEWERKQSEEAQHRLDAVRESYMSVDLVPFTLAVD